MDKRVEELDVLYKKRSSDEPLLGDEIWIWRDAWRTWLRAAAIKGLNPLPPLSPDVSAAIELAKQWMRYEHIKAEEVPVILSRALLKLAEGRTPPSAERG